MDKVLNKFVRFMNNAIPQSLQMLKVKYPCEGDNLLYLTFHASLY